LQRIGYLIEHVEILSNLCKSCVGELEFLISRVDWK